ncbi:MAG: OmpA family protein, partial [Saprospiraceae bacterium]|nr:OmpA family protein [Saprospiraceae bacterium]
MRLLTVIICLFALSTFAQAQTTQQGFTFKYLSVDYTSPATSDYTFDRDKLNPGVEIGYNRYLSPSFDLSVPFRYASLNSPTLSVPTTTSGNNQPSFGLDVAAKYKFANGYILQKKAFLQPYLVGGLGLNYLPNYTTKANFHIPLGAGLNIRLNENIFLQGQAEYRLLGDEHLAYTGGFLIVFGGEKEAPEEKEIIKIEPSDKDGDGITDDKDACPDVKGLAKFAGCPDTDNDGVKDADDKCPKVKGLAKFNGCPDTDGDGIADNLDKCPTVAGNKENGGCPEIKKEEKERLDFAMRAIQFETGKSVIKTSSYKILDEVASILIKYPNYLVSVEGHTDNVGNDASNMTLSEARAKACHDYLINKGVAAESITYKGFGETQPVADNTTEEGRT